MARRKPLVPGYSLGESTTIYPVGSPNYYKNKNRGSYGTPMHTDIGHGPVPFGAEAGPAQNRYHSVNQVRTISPVSRRRKK